MRSMADRKDDSLKVKACYTPFGLVLSRELICLDRKDTENAQRKGYKL